MIGSHLAEELVKRGYHVIGIDNLSYGSVENLRAAALSPLFQFYKVDILDLDTLKILSRDCGTIIHLAAVKKIAEKDISLPTLQVNTKGTEHIFEIAKMWGARVIFASTSDVYGMSSDLPLREDGDLLLGPSMIKRWSYAVSKLYGEQLAYGYYHDQRVPMTIIRYFGGFSPRSSFAWSGGHIPIFIRAVLHDEELIVHGDGSQTRSMGFVTDLVNGTVLALERNQAIGEVINIGNDEELSVLATARLIHKIAATGKELRLKLVPMDQVFGQYKDIQRRVPDLTKARTLLGYQPHVKLEEAIRLTIAELAAK